MTSANAYYVGLFADVVVFALSDPYMTSAPMERVIDLRLENTKGVHEIILAWWLLLLSRVERK